MSDLYMKYFVLNPTKRGPYGKASRKAIVAYADAIDKRNPGLADELRLWIQKLTPTGRSE